jgi:formate-dependent phosphoribosylglycinamide formyltransferase (GAR transformylase)
MHVVMVEPRFPGNQKRFVKALAQIGATVTAIGEGSKASLDDDLKRWLRHYEEVSNVTDEAQLTRAMQFITRHAHVDRIEATVEAHILPVARVREAMGIPGTSARTAFLCRDKPAMKEVLRAGGVPCAASGSVASLEEARRFGEEAGYPIVLKPRDGAGAAGAARVDDDAGLPAALAALGMPPNGGPSPHGRTVAAEEFLEGHEGFYDTLTQDGQVLCDFASHYYPNVLEAMRTRWISPQIVTTNRIDAAPAYEEVRAMGRRVNELLGIETSATHMEWFFGPKGLKFSEIGCRPPGIRAWDLHEVGNDMDLYLAWALAVCGATQRQRPSRRLASGIIALRPDRDGVISHIDGVDELSRRFGHYLIDWHLPSRGTPTQGVEAGYMANAWVRMKHESYDDLRGLLNWVGENVKVYAR